MSNEHLHDYLINRAEAKYELSDEFTDPQDKRDVLFLLTAVMLAQDKLLYRKGVKEFFNYAMDKKNQQELLNLAREFDVAIDKFNQTANTDVNQSHINTISVRGDSKLGNERIPLLLGERQVRPREAVDQIDAGINALVAQDGYMRRSEEMGGKAKEDEGGWSELHLNAKSPKHFLATFMVDLYPGLVRRWLQRSDEGETKYQNFDTDELVRALCENMDPKSELFNLINEQHWFDSDDFSSAYRAQSSKVEK
jgi:hypothetical protein